MTIHSTLRSRLAFGIGFGVIAAGDLALVVYALATGPGRFPFLLLFPGLFPFFFLGWAALYFGLDATLSVQDGTVVYRRAIGRTVRFPTSEIAWIERFLGRAAAIRFCQDSGRKMFTVDQDFSHGDVEELAKLVGVPLHWRE